MTSEDSEKLDELEARIRKAQAEPKEEKTADSAVAPMKMSRIGVDFVSAVLGCAFVGWLADRGLGTSPWGLLAMVLIGFGIGIMNMWRAMGQKPE